MLKKPFYLQTIEETCKELKTSPKGLSTKEAQERLIKVGRNVITIKQKYKTLLFALKQFKDLIAIVLTVSAVLAFTFKDYETGAVLLLIVVVNAVIGFFQEFQAEKMISKLSQLIHPKTIVIRGGKQMEIDSSELVPGDIMVLNEGDSVTADIRVLESVKLQVNSFSITGESNPAHKTETCLREEVELSRQTNMIFTGSSVAVGNGKGIVVATGMSSEFGKIAALSHKTKEEDSPLQAEINNIVQRAVVLSIAIGSVMLFIGLKVYHISTLEAVIFAIGIGNAMVPQGLPAEVNVALALGAKRLAQQNAVVRKLSSVETLGATTFICSDKTGTITKNEMTVEKVWLPATAFSVTGIGYEGLGKIFPEDGKKISTKQAENLKRFLAVGAFASNAKIGTPDKNHPTYYVLGDPTEGAVIALCKKEKLDLEKLEKQNPEIAEIPFDSDRKMMTSIRKMGKELHALSKGAPTVILDRCVKFRDSEGREKTMTRKDRERFLKVSNTYADQAYRILAFAERKVKKLKEYTSENTEKDLVFLGLVAIMDPPREGVREAIESAHHAHVRTIIITGDAPATAMAIAQKIHLEETAKKKIFCVTGNDLDHINDHTLMQWLKENQSGIFSRVSPEQKLRIVGLLKAHHQVVAVTGDGVNDAPALKRAHIGIAMGKIGTEVAKEASQIVLADDSFVTLVSAIREGRVIYANLKKTITTVFSTNFGEFFTIVLGLIGTGLLGAPISLIAIQILLIDLFAEILPLMALTYDAPTSDVMTERPRDIRKHVLSLKTLADVAVSGLFMGIFSYGAFLIFFMVSGESFQNVQASETLHREAMTVTYTTIVVATWWNVLLRRRGFNSIFNRYTFTNWKLWFSLGISLIMVLTVIYIPAIHPYSEMAPLSAKSWGITFACSTLFMLMIETKKMIQRSFIKSHAQND